VTYFLAGARDAANAHFDFPVSASVTLQPGQQFTYQASQALSAAGSYTAWPAWYDGANWHELGPHVSFTVSPAPPVTARIEQNESEVALGPTEWSWTTGTDARASGGTYIASPGGNSTVTITFTGTGISWIGIADTCSGQAAVSVDGASQTVDAYRAAGGGWQQTLFTRSGLPSGTHTLQLRALGTRQSGSCGSWIYVDAFDVTR
jgi:hypothetical protein